LSRRAFDELPRESEVARLHSLTACGKPLSTNIRPIIEYIAFNLSIQQRTGVELYNLALSLHIIARTITLCMRSPVIIKRGMHRLSLC
jgi:hypothetical protein